MAKRRSKRASGRKRAYRRAEDAINGVTFIVFIAAILVLSIGYFFTTAYIELPGGGFEGDFGGGGEFTAPLVVYDLKQSADTAGVGDSVILSACWVVNDDRTLSADLLIDVGQTGTFSDSGITPSWSQDSVDAGGGSSIMCQKSAFTYVIPESAESKKIDWKLNGTLTPQVYVGEPDIYFTTTGTMTLDIVTTDITAPVCTISQSSDSILEGGSVTLLAACEDETGVSQISLLTDETGTMEAKIGMYNSPAIVGGTTTETASFTWSNPAIKGGTTVKWKVTATDTLFNAGDSGQKAFTIGTAVDATAPTAGTPVYSTLTPLVGQAVEISVSFSDNAGLASAVLVLNGKDVDSKTLTGTFDTAEFVWIPAAEGTYDAQIRGMDASGNEVLTSTLTFTAQTTEMTCEPAARPADTDFGECVNSQQTKSVYVCDTSSGQWKAQVQTRSCTMEEEEETTTAALIPVIAIILILAVVVAAYFLVVRKKLAGAAPKPRTRMPAAPPAKSRR